MIRAASEILITSSRLFLAPAARADYAEWAELRHSSRAHLEPWEPRWPDDALTRRDWRRRLQAWNHARRAGSAYVFLLRRLSDNVLLGGASLTQVRPWPASSASLGYWMGQRHTGHGYMQEAVASLCDWAFLTLGLARIEAGILPENVRSRRVLERTGFRQEGLAAGYLEIDGVRREHVLFGLVRPELLHEVVL